jgi:hypothetical protein
MAELLMTLARLWNIWLGLMFAIATAMNAPAIF